MVILTSSLVSAREEAAVPDTPSSTDETGERLVRIPIEDLQPSTKSTT